MGHCPNTSPRYRWCHCAWCGGSHRQGKMRRPRSLVASLQETRVEWQVWLRRVLLAEEAKEATVVWHLRVDLEVEDLREEEGTHSDQRRVGQFCMSRLPTRLRCWRSTLRGLAFIQFSSTLHHILFMHLSTRKSLLICVLYDPSSLTSTWTIPSPFPYYSLRLSPPHSLATFLLA
jgi:hypothetical protein